MTYGRFMRLILFFDLPTKTKNDLKNYRYFIKNLKKIGFYRLQESVFVKLSIDSQNMSSTINKIMNLKLSDGDIRILTVTEKQFSSMTQVIGENKSDVLSTTDRVVEI